MSTEAQINANRENAKHSTGPTTAAGREASSQNHITHGLYTRHAFVKPEERELYQQFCTDLLLDLKPDGPLEKILASDITSAAVVAMTNTFLTCTTLKVHGGEPWT